jgi:NAD(P)-dependent dehydrogenase (short-subunit alcohol dehydrogenase family)
MFGLFGGPFNPDRDIPSLAGKVLIITGANAGLGYESLIQLAKHSPDKIYLCARSKAKYDAAMKGITAAVPNAASFVKYLELDLASLSSVAAAADVFSAENTRLDILMNNAGIMAQPPALTKDGYEIQFGTNHVGHHLLTKKLLPILQKTAASEPNADVRIINLTSEGHKFAPKPTGFIPETCTTDMASYNTFTRYGQSKLANILFTNELVRRYPAITSVSIHPGGVATGLSTSFAEAHPWVRFALMPVWKMVATQPSVGAYNQTWASVAPVEGKAGTVKEGLKAVKQGAYYVPVTKKGSITKFAQDGELSKQLWEWTEEELKKHGY